MFDHGNQDHNSQRAATAELDLPRPPKRKGFLAPHKEFKYPVSPPSFSHEDSVPTLAPESSRNNANWHRILAARISAHYSWSAVFIPGKVCKCECCEFRQRILANELKLTCKGTKDVQGHDFPAVSYVDTKVPHEDCTYGGYHDFISGGDGYPDEHGAGPPMTFRGGPDDKPRLRAMNVIPTWGPICPGHRFIPDTPGKPGQPDKPGTPGSHGMTKDDNPCVYQDSDNPSQVVPNNCKYIWHFKSEGTVFFVKKEPCDGSGEGEGLKLFVEFTLEGEVDSTGKSTEPKNTQPAPGGR